MTLYRPKHPGPPSVLVFAVPALATTPTAASASLGQVGCGTAGVCGVGGRGFLSSALGLELEGFRSYW